MKVLITGGAGYIGSVTTAYLLDNGFEVNVLDNLSTGHEKFIDKRAKFFLGDILDSNSIIIYCKNTLNTFDINNLSILSHCIPILTDTNTFFTIIPKSTKTDYKIQIDYLIRKNLDTNTALATVSDYSKLLFNIINSFFNTITLSIKNTINNDLTINLDEEFNISQLSNYKSLLSIDGSIDNQLLENINSYFDTYKNNQLNSYSNKKQLL